MLERKLSRELLVRTAIVTRSLVERKAEVIDMVPVGPETDLISFKDRDGVLCCAIVDPDGIVDTGRITKPLDPES